MRILLIFVVCFIATVSARTKRYAEAFPEAFPQYSYPRPTDYPDRSPTAYPTPPPTYLPPCGSQGGGRPTATCASRETSPGVYDFTCQVVDECAITIQREDILWLKADGKDETINVVVPNYRLEEVIKAAFKSGPGKRTGVNILLKRPTITAEAEYDDKLPPRGQPEVNVEYEQVPQREVVHYPVDQNYRALSGPILEPQKTRY